MARTKRSQERERLCRICRAAHRETEFPKGTWTCPDCTRAGRVPSMPLVRVNERYHRYDTSRVFAGYRVNHTKQGDRRDEYETEVPSPLGEFYAAGEDTIAFVTKTARAASTLRAKFPELRQVVVGDDGRTVLLMPASLFPRVARHVRAFKSRAGKPATEAQAAALDRARAARGEQPRLAL